MSGEKAGRRIGEAPGIGKVLRSPQSGTVTRKGALTAAGRKRRRQRILAAWSLVFAACSMGVVLFFVISHFMSLAPAPGKITVMVSDTPDLDSIFSDDPSGETVYPDEKETLSLVTRAIANRDPDKVGEFFRLSNDRTPEDVIRVLERIESGEGSVVGTEWFGAEFANGVVMGQVVVHMEKDGAKVNRLAQTVEREGGGFLVDFDSYIRATSSPWDSILSGEAPTSTVRVFIATDTYYNGPFSDDAVWQSYALVSPDTDVILHGYARKNSSRFNALEKILETEKPLHRATLEITCLPESGKDQFEISRVLAENWVIGETAFDESF